MSLNINLIEEYINTRHFITETYSTEKIESAAKFAELVLNIFFEIPEDYKSTSGYELAVAEETIYLLQNDPTSNYLSKYEGLIQFNVAGAIQGTVAQEYLPYISPLVKKLLLKEGILMTFSDSVKISYGYTIF